MDFHSHVHSGNALSALQTAGVYGALWAIGSAWSTAIRQISVTLFPTDHMDVVVAEIVAATITTILGVGVSMLIARNWCRSCSRCMVEEEQPPVSRIVSVSRPQTIASRR